MWKRLRRLFIKRREWPNLYTQLANMRVCFDLQGATDEQLMLIWVNHITLTSALLNEMNKRGIDVDAIVQETKRQDELGNFDNARVGR